MAAPKHDTKELIELNIINFQGNCLTVEEAKPRLKSAVQYNLYSGPHTAVSRFPESENSFPKNN